MTNDTDAWFAPKAFGYGAGLPVAWQGWALLGAYTAALLGLAAMLLPGNAVAFGALTIVLTVALVVIAARHTSGGWKWRWGGGA